MCRNPTRPAIQRMPAARSSLLYVEPVPSYPGDATFTQVSLIEANLVIRRGVTQEKNDSRPENKSDSPAILQFARVRGRRPVGAVRGPNTGMGVSHGHRRGDQQSPTTSRHEGPRPLRRGTRHSKRSEGTIRSGAILDKAYPLASGSPIYCIV